MLKYLAVPLALVMASLATGQDSPAGFSSVESSFGTDGKETWGSIGICVMNLQSGPVACFGLEKEAKSPARYTYFMIFKQDPKKPVQNQGIESEFKAEGDTLLMKSRFDLGDQELVIDRVRKLDAKTNKVLEETLKIGDQRIGKGGSAVMILDLSSGKLVARPVKAELPKSTPDLADQEHKTWSDAIKKAIAEIKDQSPEAKKLLE